MLLGASLRRQARVWALLAEEYNDPYLADRLKMMATDLIAKADEYEELPSERLGNKTSRKLLAA